MLYIPTIPWYICQICALINASQNLSDTYRILNVLIRVTRKQYSDKSVVTIGCS
jgi:hypothetical protein